MSVIDVLRLVCGLFFLPHLVLKFVFLPDTIAFFRRARLPYPRPLIYLDAVVEIIVASLLITNVYVRYAACVAALHLLVAGVAVWIANGHTWRWNRGGPEYPIFWAIMCITLAVFY